MIFRSKIDIRLFSAVFATAIFVFITAFLTFFESSDLSWIGAYISLMLGAVLPLWILNHTAYEVRNKYLFIRSGPFFWIIPLASISRIEKTKSFSPSPALSFDRLKIEYGTDKIIFISPSDTEVFLTAVRNHTYANPP